MDDAAVTTKVKAQLLREPTFKAAETNVDIFKGVAQLTGCVGTKVDVDKAAELARKVPGVTDVRNGIQIKGEREVETSPGCWRMGSGTTAAACAPASCPFNAVPQVAHLSTAPHCCDEWEWDA